ncbi:MAG: inverse autotransporter beta domain-containing protein, partial [Lentisphaerota bacterium]
MTMRIVLYSVLASSLATLPFNAAAKSKEPAISTADDSAPAWPAAEVTVGGQFRDAEAEGIGDILVPVWSHSSGLFFVNPRASRTDHSEEEYNLGIGYRQLIPQGPFIVGANAYYDYRDTDHSSYDQWGIGLEFLSRWVDARANYYHPQDKKTTVGSDTEQSVTTSSSTQSGWTDPYATDHEVAQSYITEKTTRTTTTTLFFEQYERAMEGYDGEIGLRLPLPVRPESIDTRVFGGYYLYDAEFGDDVKGFKARLEVRLLSSLFFDAAWFENKDLTGSDYYVGGRFSFPFDLAALARGRNPFAEMDSRFQRKDRPFDARLTEMVMRDPQIRTEISSFMERPDLRTVDTKTDKDSSQQDFTLMDDVTFVDLDTGSGAGRGTAQSSFDSIQEGVDHAFGDRNVYVFDASSSYRENVALAPGVTLWGSGCLIPGYGGKSFGSGIRPTVDGSSMGPAVTMANNSTLRGFRITNTDRGEGGLIADLPVIGEMDISRVGVLGRDATDYTVMCNVIEDTREGAIFSRQGNFTMSFLDNIVQNNSDVGLVIGASGNGAGMLTAPAGLPSLNGPAQEPFVVGDEIAYLPSSGSFNVLIDNSSFLNNGLGLDLAAFNYEWASAEIRSSQFNGNEEDGANLVMVGNTLASATVLGSKAQGNGDTGFNIVMGESEEAKVTLSGVSAHNNNGSGVNTVIFDSELAMARVDRARALGNEDVGLGVIMEDNTVALVNMSGLTANDNGEMGV